MNYVYVIYSGRLDRYYKGQTNNMVDRLRRHNNGEVQATQHGKPWELRCFIEKENRGAAMILERKLKNMNRAKLEKFILKYGSSNQDVDFVKS